jgi:hypothetical protein
VESPRIVDWAREAPFHRFVDYADVRLKRARIVEGAPLIRADRGAIASWGSRMGQAWIRLGFGFAVEEGDFAMRPAFPLFLRDAIAWLAGEGRRGFPLEARVGEALVNARPLPVARGEGRVTEVAGGTARIESAPIEDARLRWVASRTALLKIEVDGRVEWVAANDPAAGTVDLSAVAPRTAAEAPEQIPWWRDLPLAVVAGALVALLLLAEWWVYHALG